MLGNDEITDLKKSNLLIVGAGGHAKSCIDVIHASNQFIIKGLIGLDSQVGETVMGYPILGTDDDLNFYSQECECAVVGVGQIKTPRLRLDLFQKLTSIGYRIPVVVSSHACVSSFASVGSGTIVMSGAVINADTSVGSNNIINSQSLLEHDVVIGNHCHIATGARVNGGVTVGNGSFVGSGAILREGITVGENSVIGAGQVVLHDVPANTTVKE